MLSYRKSLPAAAAALLVCFSCAYAQAPPDSGVLFERIAQLEAAARNSPKDADAHVRLAQAQQKSGRYRRAEETLRAVLDAEPKNVSALTALGRLHQKKYEFTEAAAILKTLEKIAPKDVRVRLFAADTAMLRMDHAAARKIYNEIVKKDPRQIDALYGLAALAYAENRPEEAEDHLKQCFAIDPEHAASWLLQGQIHQDRQETEKFAAAVRRAVASDPFDATARAVYSIILMRYEKKLSEGRVQLDMALRLDPYSELAHSLIGNGWTDRVYPDLSIPLDGGKKAELLDAMAKGDEALNTQKSDAADAAFDKALALLPTHIPALIGKGVVQYNRRNYDEALKWFFAALRIDPAYGLAHYGVTQSLLRKKDLINVQLAEAEKLFAAKDAPEPEALRDVFKNHADLDPEMQKIVRLSVQPLKSFLPRLKETKATYYIFPFHHFLWQVPNNEELRGTRTFDGRLWDDIKGNGGNNATAGVEWERGVKYLRYNVLTHEFAHQVHQAMPDELKAKIKQLYETALKEDRTLDFYAASNDFEYFAQGVEAYVSERKLSDQKTTYGHTREELRRRDPALYALIDELAKR